MDIETEKLSGCELKALIEKIGYKNIATLSDSSILLREFSNKVILDSICNDTNRDTNEIIMELFKAELVLSSSREELMVKQMEKMLSDAFA